MTSEAIPFMHYDKYQCRFKFNKRQTTTARYVGLNKLIGEILIEIAPNLFKVDNKNTRTISMTSFWCFYCLLWTDLKHCSGIFIVDFEQVYGSWNTKPKNCPFLIIFNPFVPNAPFLYPLKTAENLIPLVDTRH